MLGLFRLATQMLALAAFVYVAVFVPIGRYTLYRHATRIAATAEAGELTDAVGALFARARSALVDQARAQGAADVPMQDD